MKRGDVYVHKDNGSIITILGKDSKRSNLFSLRLRCVIHHPEHDIKYTNTIGSMVIEDFYEYSHSLTKFEILMLDKVDE